MAPTSPNITTNLHGITKWIKKQILQDLKLRRVNYILISLNAQTAEKSIKLTQTLVHFGSIASTTTGTIKNNKNFTKVEVTWFAQP